jgi:mono/diheme cytochrome c family protein
VGEAFEQRERCPAIFGGARFRQPPLLIPRLSCRDAARHGDDPDVGGRPKGAEAKSGQKAMPPMKPFAALPAADIDALVAYVQSLIERRPTAAVPMRA